MTLDVKPLIEINQRAIRILYKELGIVNAIRFLKQYTIGLGDYTEERDFVLGNKTLKEIIGDIESVSNSQKS